MKICKCLSCIIASCAMLLCCGCRSMMKNVTPAQVPQNGSEVYTLEMQVLQNGKTIVQDSCSARIVIDGQIYKMNKTGDRSFTYNYRRPANKHRASYYYELDYKTQCYGQIHNQFERSKLYELTIANRYVVGFESNRGIPGSTIILLGRGFEQGDYIEIDGVTCDTTFISGNSLSFVVPMLSKHGLYHAKLVSDNGDIGLGNFQIDQISMHVNHEQIDLAPGEKQALIVTVDCDAPEAGITIEVTTNIPDSIIMRDIFIPAGAHSATAVIEGGDAGSGMLYLSAGGFEEVKIPVEVTGGSSESFVTKDNDPLDEEFLTL